MANDPEKLVSVVVVTCGVADYISDCLNSLKLQSHKNIEVVVIENSVNPSLLPRIKEVFPGATVEPLAGNASFSVSLNCGIDSTRGEFILCLNDDVVLERDFIRQALNGFVDEKVGMVSGKILRMGKRVIDSTGLSLSIFCTPKERGYSKIDAGQFEEKGFIFGVSGCVALYRRKMLNAVKDENGYFDSRFLMYYEDLDLCWRANRKKWKAYYIPQAIAYHARGGSCRQPGGIGSSFARRYLDDRFYASLLRNRFLTLIKNENLPGFFLCLLPVIFYDLISLGYTIIFRPRAIRFIFRNR